MLLDHLLWKHHRFNKSKSLQTIFVFVILYLLGLFFLLFFFKKHFIFFFFSIHFVYYYYNFWAYPILDKLNEINRIGFFLFVALFLSTTYLISDTILYFRGSKIYQNKEKQK